MDDFNPNTANDAQLTLYLARQGISPLDTQKSLDAALARVEECKERAEGFVDAAFPDERPWEEFELERCTRDAT